MLSYLDFVSFMFGILEFLVDDVSFMGLDLEINGLVLCKMDKYGFFGGSQYLGSLESFIFVDVVWQWEFKWLDMFSNWDKWLLW